MNTWYLPMKNDIFKDAYYSILQGELIADFWNGKISYFEYKKQQEILKLLRKEADKKRD